MRGGCPRQRTGGGATRGDADGLEPRKSKSAQHQRRKQCPRLRKSMMDAERRLWTALRKEMPETPGTHFRRQMAIGPYVVDFVCLRHRLIVEVDGKFHDVPDQRLRDAERDAYLRSENFRVLRFSNEKVMREMPSVLRNLAVALATPTPSPSPQEGGEL
ncbi:endonuclease domain-containing protein [Neorhizobium sp. IRAMC:178]|uniref:endonuclease domain-containing protein n=1 Tax=Neorhizobium tunisiense TaxID=3144793 RepID=UPI0031F65704